MFDIAWCDKDGLSVLSLLEFVNIIVSGVLFIKPGIQDRGTEYGEGGGCSLGFRRISWRIPGNVIILTFQGMFKNIPGNVSKNSGECSRRFRGIFNKIPGNVSKDSEKC